MGERCDRSREGGSTKRACGCERNEQCDGSRHQQAFVVLSHLRIGEQPSAIKTGGRIGHHFRYRRVGIAEGICQSSLNANLPSFQTPLVQKLAVQGRYNQSLCLRVSSCSLQGVAVRPLPCNYFHGGNTGSNPVGDASLETTTSRFSLENS